MLKADYRLIRLADTHFAEVKRLEQVSHSHPWSDANIMSALSSDRLQVLGIFDQRNALAAYAVFDCIVDELTLQNIAVAKHHRGQGLAKYLINHSWAVFPAAQTQFLEVRASNTAAISLYQVLGFCEVGIRANYYPHKTGREDAVIMALPRPMDN